VLVDERAAPSGARAPARGDARRLQRAFAGEMCGSSPEPER
jgi:hypothetical protein